MNKKLLLLLLFCFAMGAAFAQIEIFKPVYYKDYENKCIGPFPRGARPSPEQEEHERQAAQRAHDIKIAEYQTCKQSCNHQSATEQVCDEKCYLEHVKPCTSYTSWLQNCRMRTGRRCNMPPAARRDDAIVETLVDLLFDQ